MCRAPTAIALALLLPACATAMRGCFSRERSESRAVPADPGPPRDEIVVAQCDGLGGSNETCRITLRIDSDRCGGARRCDRLIAFFPDEAADCGREARVLRVFAEAGFVASCVALYETADAARVASLAAREERARTALDVLGADERVRASWTARELLVAGDGMGAGTAMRSLVRTERMATAERVTACLFDGIYDVAAHYQALDEREARGERCRESRDALTTVYCDARADPRACDDEAIASMRDDSVDVADPGSVLVERALLFECGSELSSCDQDGSPAEQSASLCESLGEGRCEMRSAPRVSHERCAVRNVDACIEWAAR